MWRLSTGEIQNFTFFLVFTILSKFCWTTNLFLWWCELCQSSRLVWKESWLVQWCAVSWYKNRHRQLSFQQKRFPPIIMVLLSPLSHQLLQRWQITALWCFAVWCIASTALDAPGQCCFASWLSFGEPSLLELRCHRVETLRLSMVTLSWIPQNCLFYAESNSAVGPSRPFVVLRLFRRTS